MFERKIKTVPFRDLPAELPEIKPVCYVVNGKKVIRIVGIAGLSIVAFAGIPDIASAATGSGLDAGGHRIYRKLVGIGKWVIIIKGGIDCIQSVTNGDFQQAKKQVLSHLVIFGILLGLPWALGQIESLFDDLAEGGL